MALPLLRTKLHRPPAGGMVRDRLLRALDTGLERPFTLVSAPAGFGKTTLVTRWIEERGVPAAWFAVDEGDAEPRRFWSYVVAALETLDGVGVEATRAILESPEPDVEGVVGTLLNELTVAKPRDGRAVLVLDDLHAVEAPGLFEGLTLFLDRLPPTVSVIVTTRSDPPLPLARYRTRRRMAEVRQRDLRFSPEEVRAFLLEEAGVDLSEDAVEALEDRTEGWAASLHLAGLSLNALPPDERDAFVRDFAGDDRFVMDYLVDEVLSARSAPVQRFLLATSVLDRMTDPLCAAVLAEAEGDGADAPALAELERSGLFVIPLDHRREWYRYHHLFRDLLGVRCREEMDEGALLLAASRWCEARDLIEESVEYGLRAGEVEHAAWVLEERFPDLIGMGELGTIRRFVDALPSERVHGSTALCMAMSYVESLQAHMAEAERWMERGEAVLAELDPTEERMRIQRTHLSLLRGFHAEGLQDLDAALERFDQAREGFDAIGYPYLVSVAEQGLAGARYAREELDEAARSARRAWSLGLEHGNLLAGASGVMKLVLVLTAQGRLRDAEREVADAQASIEARLGEEGGLVGAYLRTGVADLLIRRDRLAEARERIASAELVARSANYPVTLARAAMGRLRLALAVDDLDAAGAASDDLEALFASGRVTFIVERLAEVMRVRLWLRRGAEGDARRAAEWAASVERTGPFPTPTGLALARVRLARGETREAAVDLRGLADGARARGAHGWEREALLLRALALERLRDPEALDVAARVLASAAPEDDLGPFLEEGPEAAELLARVQAKRGDAAPLDFIARLQGAFSTRAEPAPSLLTDRQMEVLRLLDAGLSNQEVAERLFLSVGTVKKHSHDIYQKLDASRRSEALARARERGLLKG